MPCWASHTGHIHAGEHGPGHDLGPCTMPARLKTAAVCNMMCLGVLLVSTGGNPCVSAPIYPDTPSVKGHGETDMEDHDTSHHYMCSFHIVAALFLVMEAIKEAHLLHNLDFNQGAVSNLIILHFQ